ncbi:35727_t:CDS:2 [Gigaspora margarita]|uniref:35727_t:CDS:1 n=1 Tax=Gigaspora margarita TaxID=4874 RepID=A0ABN7UCU3_GIGMA|nr:35727_t:CDS:2 [Gigaspora margarita]
MLVLMLTLMNFYNDYLLYKTVENGNKPELKVREDKIVPRLQILASLIEIFQPDVTDIANYHVVTGEHGSGKTTMSVIAAQKIGQGVIYVNIKGNIKDLKDLGKVLGKAINFKESVSLMGHLTRKIIGLDSTAAAYKKKYKKLPVLVFDNISALDKSHSEILDLLQENAKEVSMN